MNATKTPLPIESSKDGRDFEKLVKWASAFSIAVIAGFLASLKQINPAIEIRITALSVIAFIAGGVVTLLFVHAVLASDKRHRALLVVVVGIVTVIGFFLFGIRSASPDSRRDVTIGTAIAVTVLSFLGWVLWRMARYLELDEEENSNQQ